MKRTHHIIISLLAILLTATGCDKHDDNGDLGGMWQLTLWTDGQGDTLATNETDIYYYFQLRLMKVERKGDTYYLARFNHSGDSLVVGEVYSQPFDSIVGIDLLAPYGVPADGRFHVDGLSSSHMQLSGGTGTLRFRKY